MAEAVLWQLLCDIQAGIRNDLILETMGSEHPQTVQSEAIVIRKSDGAIGPRADQGMEQLPGILISPVKSLRPGDAGPNAYDDVEYQVLIQIIDGDQSHRTDGVRTYLKWSEQIAKYLHNQRRADIDSTDGYITIGHVVTMDHLDERLFKAHKLMQVGILVTYYSREPRGVT